MRRRSILVWLAGSLLQAPLARAEPQIEDFLLAGFGGVEESEAALARIESAGWRDGYAAIVVDLIDLLQRTSFVRPESWLRLRNLIEFLERQTGPRFGGDLTAWRRWVWSLPYEPHPDYAQFKGILLARLDPRFGDFFDGPVESSIRLDEIQWGGVAVNGIPPLDHPQTIAADAAAYLADDDIVFGVYLDGNARAYPKRILAWHELALDRLGAHELTIVYCTLCGTVIPFESEAGGTLRHFGTSGLLYQSNKLMFDHETNSLWSSLTGRPVVGPLVGSGLELAPRAVVTTTWGEWRRRHPDTSVLSLDTGFVRDYSEGAAYRDYFATDNLMFDVSQHDERLPNKAEVLALRVVPRDRVGADSIAIDVALLREQPVYHVETRVGSLVVITDRSGANRVYEAAGQRFVAVDGEGRVHDAAGGVWRLTEDALVSARDPESRLARVPAHRSFWFGWAAQHPRTLLIR